MAISFLIICTDDCLNLTAKIDLLFDSAKYYLVYVVIVNFIAASHKLFVLFALLYFLFFIFLELFILEFMVS